jgi:Vacuolar protein sorting-associated protein 62
VTAIDRRWRPVATAVLALWLLATSAAASSALSAAPRDVALRFQPHLLFDSAERWRPVDVDALLAEPGHQVCASSACVALTSLSQLAPPAQYIDLRGTRPDGSDASAPDLATCARSQPTLLDCDEGGRSAIYAHVRRSGTRIAIDYWWFLRYNAFLIDLHEGDWEGVSVLVNAAGTRVQEVHFAAHASVWHYADDVPTIDGSHHVRVYLARGSHAAYPKPCSSSCLQTQSVLPEGRFNGRSAWVDNDAAACARRCVRLFPEAQGAPASWNAWNGLWGVPRSALFPPPRTPAFQGRYLNPFASTTSGRHEF